MAFFNGDTVSDLATSFDTTIALSPLLLASKMSVEVATKPLIGIDILVDSLKGDTWFAICFLVAIDLFGAPIFAEHFFNSSSSHSRNTAARNTRSWRFGQPMRLFWSIASQTCVALQFTTNRRFVDGDLLSNCALCKSSFLQSINLVTLTSIEAVIGSHLCSFTLDGEKRLVVAASRIIASVKLHWRVDSAILKYVSFNNKK